MVTVAATGAGLALPLLGAGAGVANAADAGTWDKVAVCETGGLWSADTHNGFYGGLAITQDTWDQYGGDAYAQRPDLASRSQQIAVAEKILADLGPDAWPDCEQGTGLLKDTAPPDVDPGATSAPAPSAPTTAPVTPPVDPTDPALPPDTSGTPGGSGASGGTAVPGAPVTGTPGGTDAPTTPSGPAAGTPTTAAPPATVDPADPAVPANPITPPGGPTGTTAPDAPAAGGRHAKPYSPTDEQLVAADRASRTEVTAITENDPGSDNASDTADNTGKASNKNNASNTDNGGVTDPGSYRIGAGDSLSGIAAAHGVDGGWKSLYDVNHQVIGDNPNLIKPGQIIALG